MLYVFPRDYRSKLATKSLRIQIEPFLDKAKVLSDLLMIYLKLIATYHLWLAGCCGLFDTCYVWYGAYCVYCYRLHFNYTLAFKQKVTWVWLVYNGIGLKCALTFLLIVRMIIGKGDVGVDMILDSISTSALLICFGNLIFLV